MVLEHAMLFGSSLSDEQRKSFEQRCREIMKKAPKKLRRKWDGIIYWPMGKPMVAPAIVERLPEPLANQYYDLLRETVGRVGE